VRCINCLPSFSRPSEHNLHVQGPGPFVSPPSVAGNTFQGAIRGSHAVYGTFVRTLAALGLPLVVSIIPKMLAFLLASSWGRYSFSRGLESLVRLTPGSFMFIWHHPLHEADKASWSLQCLLLLVLRVHSHRVLSVSAFALTASDLRW
jgi:hypothetical protein